MDHSYYQERLSAFADHELAPEERAKVAEHLRECGECQKRLNELEALSQLTSRHSVLDDSDYWEKAARKIEGRLVTAATSITVVTPKQGRQMSGLWWKLPAIAASVVLVGYVGLHESDILNVADTETRPAVRESMSVTPPEERADRKNLPDSVMVAEKPAINRPQPAMLQDIREERGAEAESISEGWAVEEETFPDKTEAPVYVSPAHQEDKLETSSDRLAITTEDRDANYKRRSPLKAASEQAEAGPAAPDVEVDDILDFYTSTVTETYRLDDWRQRRDSILLAIQDLPPEASLRQWKSKRAQGFTAAPETETARIAGYAVELATEAALGRELLEAWYQICLLSDDSAERTIGKELLDSVATDEGSPNRNLADSLYKLLEQQ